jgi:hypothetical protein
MKIIVHSLLDGVCENNEFIVYLTDNNDNKLEAELCKYDNLMEILTVFRTKMKK